MQPFSVAAVQACVYPYFVDERYEPHPEHLARNLERACEMVSHRARAGGTRLYCFAEFGFTGSPAGQPAETYLLQAVRIPGPETEMLSAVARRRRVYISAQFYEVDDGWPGRFFNTSFILSPDGDVILKYRKHYDNTCKTKPGDVWTRYCEVYGVESLFPVVETEIGRLGVLCAYEINLPEVARSLALNGAEILIHHTSEGNNAHTLHRTGGWDLARAVRAYENLAYLVSVNEGWFLGSARPAAYQRGRSQIVDFHGQILSLAETDAETIITAEIDLDALRRRRTQLGRNFLAQLQAGIYARVLRAKADLLWPADAWAGAPVRLASQNNALARHVIARMQAAGIYAPPDRAPEVDHSERWQ